jgi:hypothetical protein
MCPHGQLYASCYICREVKKSEEEYMELNDLLIEDDNEYDMELDEQLYDYYLDLDERLLREQEDSL